jgi:DNA-binding transcriptional LysR family regulator
VVLGYDGGLGLSLNLSLIAAPDFDDPYNVTQVESLGLWSSDFFHLQFSEVKQRQVLYPLFNFLPMDLSMHELRRLDFDDLLLLLELRDGKTLTSAAETLSISQPAVSQRLRKIEEVFGLQILKQQGRRLIMTDEGMSIASRASSALKLMQTLNPQPKKAVINIGTRPEVGMSWLGKAVLELRQIEVNLCFHIHIASGSEILQKLGVGQLDAVLTSAPLTLRDYRSIELVPEEYIFVAHKSLRPKIRHWDDLKSHILIEYDRSFPFLRYLDPESRVQATFEDVWFVGSTALMAEAIERAQGVGIVPRYLVQKSIDAGELVVLNLAKKLSHDKFRFVLRADPVLESYMNLLANHMRKLGLR